MVLLVSPEQPVTVKNLLSSQRAFTRRVHCSSREFDFLVLIALFAG